MADDNSKRRGAVRGVHATGLKAMVVAIESLHSFATCTFVYLFYFYTRDEFGFGAKDNFFLAAALGVNYGAWSLLSGRVAQRRGYFWSLGRGLLIMAASAAAASLFHSFWVVLVCFLLANTGMAFTWVALEALISEGEPRGRLQRLLGIYNVTWALTGSMAYFFGGALYEHCGHKSIFLVPAGCFALEWLACRWLEAKAASMDDPAPVDDAATRAADADQASKHSPIAPSVFLKMAWLANPFAYVSLNTVLPIVPTLASHFALTPTWAGIVCSTWMFARTASFLGLALWDGWRYRFRFLATGYVSMIASFALMLMVQDLWVLVGAQIVFGLALGLMYYSSLFYSMDVGTEAKGEHGGIHECVIGAGCAAGPGIAALALQFGTGHPNSGILAASGLMVVGLVGLFKLRYGGRMVGG